MKRSKCFILACLYVVCMITFGLINSRDVFSEDKNTIYNHDKKSWDDLAITDTKTQKAISIGMSKEKVDKIIGIQKKKDYKNMYNYQGLEVFYRNNKVAGMVINASKNLTKRFITSDKIGLGNTRDEIIKIYGNCIEKNDTNKFMTFYYTKKDKSLIKIDDIMKVNNKGNLYCISFSFFDNGKIRMILISDYQFAMNMN